MSALQGRRTPEEERLACATVPTWDSRRRALWVDGKVHRMLVRTYNSGWSVYDVSGQRSEVVRLGCQSQSEAMAVAEGSLRERKVEIDG